MRRIDELIGRCGREILTLDGAMGTMIQAAGGAGLHEALCVEKPSLIRDIHAAYLDAGAAIIETCSFNANAISLADYGCAGRAYELSLAAARLAREAADSRGGERPFVAGVLGPGTKSAGISPDPGDPAARAVYWDELFAAYFDNARGLLDGGADFLLIETVFDTLNAKAACAACLDLFETRGLSRRGKPNPLMISASAADASGRLLAGHSVEAFAVSLAHALPFALGLNCSLGASAMLPLSRRVSAAVPCLASAHPNAGFPDESGAYTQSPEEMARELRPFVSEGLVNILGSCCGSTPEHTRAVAALARSAPPRRVPAARRVLTLAGLDALAVEGPGVTVIGEGGNAPGSARFLAALSSGDLPRCLALIRENVERGADMIDLCADDGLLDAKELLPRLALAAQSDPFIARAPLVLDSSDWGALEAALKVTGGKPLVNSLSLKEGEAAFLERAKTARRYGAAPVVMLFDERGQALTSARKVEIARRAFGLLDGIGVPPEEIVFDLNVLAVATGMPEHDRCALEFIRAVAPVTGLAPGVNVSAGVSNLSFGFRGNGAARRALHAVFLDLCRAEGMRLAIADPRIRGDLAALPAPLERACRDLLLARGAGAAERLIAEAAAAGGGARPEGVAEEAEAGGGAERVRRAVLRGKDETLDADIRAALEESGAAAVLEGPLMDAMKEVSDRYGRGELYLPQVLASARAMKRAVGFLSPALKTGRGARREGKVILATVRGDVHDIGKNIAGIVLDCAGFEIEDLGVMVPSAAIVEAARRGNAAAVGLSGLITPSLGEMIEAARALGAAGYDGPLLIGGAAASLAHTALRIAPEYRGAAVYVPDAGAAAPALRALLSPARRGAFKAALEAEYRAAREAHAARAARRGPPLGLAEARANKPRLDWT